jgi:hypothetical protein
MRVPDDPCPACEGTGVHTVRGMAVPPPDTTFGFCPACVRMRWITASGVCTQCEREGATT